MKRIQIPSKPSQVADIYCLPYVDSVSKSESFGITVLLTDCRVAFSGDWLVEHDDGKIEIERGL